MGAAMKRSVLAFSCLLSACATLEEVRWGSAPEGPSSWRAGFIDGCMSGRQDARGIHHPDVDKARFRADDQYRSGWQQGRDECFQREREALAAPPAPTPDTETAALPEPAPPPAPPPPAAPPPLAPAADTGHRRAEIERRIVELKRELGALEAELSRLPE
jgi:hypothetical protein